MMRSGATILDLRISTGFENIYCFICGLALLAGVSFEPLWDFVDRVDMYMFL